MLLIRLKAKRVLKRGQSMADADISFRQERLTIGKSLLIPHGTQVQLEIDGILAKLKSYSVGFLPEDCLIFKYPSMTSLGPISHKLFKGNKIIVGYIDKGNVFGFQSEILGFITEPVKLIFVAYPSVIARHNLRKGKRVACSLLAEADVDGEKFEGLITDISETGCCLSITPQMAEQSFPSMRINQAFLIHCQMPGIEAPVEIEGRVKNFQRDTQRVSIGTTFDDVDPVVRDSIVNFILTLQKIL
jgi:c-di-GMP-binding flagellar brake protein YcgR